METKKREKGLKPALNSDNPKYKKPKKHNFYSVGERKQKSKFEFYYHLSTTGNFVKTHLLPDDFENVLHFGRIMLGEGMHDKFIAYNQNPQFSYVVLGRLN
jgi:hypothetical protein